MATLYPNTAPVTLYPTTDTPEDYPVLQSPHGFSTNVVRGLKSALLGADADSASGAYWQARAAGDMPSAQANELRANQLAAEAQRAAPRVRGLRDIHGAGDAADWFAGTLGSLPVSAVPAMGGGLAGGVLGGLVAGPAGAAIGSHLGASGGMYPQLRDAARLQQLQAEQQGAPQLAPQHVLTSTSNQGLTQSLVEGTIPGLASRSLVRGTAANVLRQPVASAAKRIGRDVVLDTGAAGVSEGVAMGYETGRDAQRDTADDGWRVADAMAGEAAGGVAYGALGHAGDVGHQLLGGGAAAVGDAASYAARAGKRGATAAWNARPQSLDEAALMVGEGAANLHNKAEDTVTRWAQKGRDADVDVLLTPQKGMDEAGLRADDAAKHQAATNFIAKTQANPGAVPDYVHAAVQQYMQGSKTMDSWRPVADAINDMYRSESILSGANDLLSDKLAPVSEALGKGAADLMNAKDDALTAYNGKRAADGRQNAMTPAMGRKIANERDDFSPILEDSLAPFTGLKSERALANALPTLGHAMRSWVANGFSMSKGGELVVPKSLLNMFTDPAEAIKATTYLMHKEGLVGDEVLASIELVLQQLDIMQTAKKQAWDIVDSNLTPTAARGKSAVDHDLIAEYYQDKLQAGASLESLMPAAQRHFGPRAIPVLEALKAQDEAMRNAISGRDRRSGGEQRVSGLSDEYGSTADNAGQNIIPGMGSEDMAQITSSHLDEDVGAPTVMYHHYRDGSVDKTTGEIKLDEPFKVRGRVKNRPDKLGNAVPDTFHDTVAKQRIAEMHGVGAREVKPQGYMDYLREKHGNDAEGLMSDAQKIIESKYDDLLKLQNKTGRMVEMADGTKQVQHDDLGKVLNDNYYVLREEAQREKGEATNVTADEFGREGANGQIIGNKWAEKVGKDGEYGTTAHGRIWLERMGSDGKPRAFATSASRVIDRMLKARKTEGRVDESSGLAGQKTALMQGLASLLTAAHPETKAGKYGKSGTSTPVLSGRVGYKERPGDEVRWLKPGEDFPASLRMYSGDKTYSDAKAAVKGAADQKILTAGKTLLKSLSTRLANMEPGAKGRGYVIEDIEDLQAALEARDARSVDVSLRKSEENALGREDDGVNEIGADTYETKPVVSTKIITRDARNNLFGSKKAALEGIKALREPGYDYRVVRSSESVVNKSGEASSRTARAASRSHHKWVIARTLTGQVRNSAETKSGKPNTRSVQVWREISSHSSQADAQSAYDAHVRQLVDEQGDDGSGWPDLRVSKMEGSVPSKTSRGTPERWAFQEAHYLRSGSTPFGSEIGEMGKATEFRSRHEDGESDGERNYDELGHPLHPFDSNVAPATDKEARAKRTEFVLNALMDGVPSFLAMARKLSPERREALTGHLQGMLDGKWPDANGRLSMRDSTGHIKTELAGRARVALIELGKMQGVTKGAVAPKAKPTFGKLEGYTNHSGAARGADTLWDVIGRKFGVTAHNHYRAEGNTELPPALKRAGSQVTVATKEQLEEGYKVLETVLGKTLERNLANDLKARNYLQVKNADAVFAIAELRTGKGDVKGGTNAAVQMAVHMNKPVHVWDTGSMTWHKWDGSTFVPTTTPTLTKNFAGIGTRDVENYNVPGDNGEWVPRAAYKGRAVEDAARQAIADVYRKTAGPSDAGKPTSAAQVAQPAQPAKPVTTLTMRYKDGSNGLSMRPEFKGKDTMDLILSGDRTATTRTSLSGFNGIKKGDVFKVEGNGKSALVRATTDPYKASTKTAEEWSKLEGWAPKEHGKYASGTVDGYQIQYELVDRPSVHPSQKFADVADKMSDYLKNPPADYNVKQVEAIRDWATKQEARLKAEAAKHEEGSDEYDRLDDLRFKATLLRAEALKALKNEAEVKAHQDETGGPRYSAMATRIHTDLGREGFAATHDSPIRHEGKFDWRAHQGKGEGNAAFGAGTYLSTADGVHRNYKEQFTAQSADSDPEYVELKAKLKPMNVRPGSVTAEARTIMDQMLARERVLLAQGKSPTYEVSVDIKPEQLLDWNKPLSEQSALVQKAAGALLKKIGLQKLKFVADEENLGPDSWYADLDLGPLTGSGKDDSVQFMLDKSGEKFKLWVPEYFDTHTLDTTDDKGRRKPLLFGSYAEAVRQAEDLAYSFIITDKLSGKELYEKLADQLGSQAKASDYLQSLGILGHKYAAAGGKNDTHPNYVIYDDSKITTNYVHFNKQDPAHKAFGTATSAPATPAEIEKFHADIARRLGPQMKSGVLEMLYGKNAKGKDIMLSGKWEKGAIYASVYARNLGQVGAHEAFHEFFDRMKGEPAAAEVMKLLDRAANAPYVVRQLERLLDGETEALKQIKQGAKNAAEERMAYMFQFWEAGLLNIGPETQNIFSKLAAFFRKVAGLLNDDERVDLLLRNFDEGKMQTADAAARVLANSVTARQKMYEGVNNAFKPMMERASRLINTAETNLERTGNPVYKEVRRMFKRSVGEDGAQGFLDAKDHQMKMWGNRLATVFEGLHPKDLELAAPYLHTGETPKDPAVKQLVARLKGPNGLLPQIHKYLTEAGVKRWEAGPDGEGGEWVPMGKIDHGYFPRAYDTAMILGNVDGFVADLVKYNPDELGAIAAAQNATLAKTVGKDFTPVTTEDVAKAIANRLINAFGQTEIEESGSSIGFSPFMQSINRRQMHWIHPEMLKKYGDKEVSRILTGYIAQGVKRAEYVRKFGNGGEVLQAKLEKAHDTQLAKLVENKFGVKDLYEKAKMAKPVDGKNSMSERMWQVVRSNNPKADKAEFDALEVKALKIAQGAAKDVMAMEGTLGYNITPKNRQFQNSVLVYENMRLLSMSLFSQFIDPLNLLVRGAAVGDAWNAYKRGLREVVASIKDDPIKDLDAKIADQVGTTDANHFLAAFGQLHGSQYLGAKFRKVNDVMFKYNGMEGFNRGMQVAATRAAINFIKRHVQTPNERSAAYLKELNLKASDVKIDKDGELDYTDPHIQQALHQWVNGSVLRPNAAQRPAWASDPHYMVFWHMKQFAYTFHDVVLKRALHDYKKFGDMGPAGMLALAYTPVMIASDALKSVLLTGDEPVWMKGGLDSELEHGAMRAGLLGKFQPMADTMAPHHSVLSLGGPAVEQITEMFTDAPADTAVNALPGANVWNTMKGNSLADGHPDN